MIRTGDYECECDCQVEQWILSTMSAIFVDHDVFWEVESRVHSSADVTREDFNKVKIDEITDSKVVLD